MTPKRGDMTELRTPGWTEARVVEVYDSTNTMQIYVTGVRSFSVPVFREGSEWRRPSSARRAPAPAPVHALGLDPTMTGIAAAFFGES